MLLVDQTARSAILAALALSLAAPPILGAPHGSRADNDGDEPAVGSPSSGSPGGSSAPRTFALGFESNVGQFSPGVAFVRRMPRFVVEVRGSGTVLSWVARPEDGARNLGAELASGSSTRGRLSWSFEGGHSDCELIGEEPLGTTAGYYVGAVQSRWRHGVPAYKSVRLRGVYPGIDAILRETNGELEYDLVAEPGANLARVRLRFEGAERIEVDGAGGLAIRTRHGTVIHRRPVVFEEPLPVTSWHSPSLPESRALGSSSTRS